MKLVFLYHPVDNLMDSLSYYRDTLGFEEAWREGEQAIALQLPGSDVKLLIGRSVLVKSVDEFFEEKKDSLSFVREAVDIPPRRYAIYKDVSGNVIRIIDFTNE